MSGRQYFDTVPSTQDAALELARQGAPAGTCVVARTQDAGRGRLDHAWVSPSGGLYLSIVREGRPEAGPLLSVSVAAGLCEMIHQQYGAPVRLRWPNDIVCTHTKVPWRKLGGVLIDVVQGVDGFRTVVGVGINVDSPLSAFPPELRTAICSFRVHFDAPPPLAEFEQAVGARIAELFAELATESGQDRYRALSRALLYGRGLGARIDGVSVGMIHGLADDGALVVLSDQGPRNFHEGRLEIEGGR